MHLVIYIATKKMFCKICIAAKQSGAKNWVKGNSSFREDKIKLHASSKLHSDSKKKLELRKQNKSAADILEPVSKNKYKTFFYLHILVVRKM